MKLLLDTHVWIWSLENPKKLGRRVSAALVDRRNELWLSPISVWEVLVLMARGRLKTRQGFTPEAWVEAALERVPLREAPITVAVALRSRSIQLSHDDPADRFIAASAAVHELTLVTADERLLEGSGYRMMANG